MVKISTNSIMYLLLSMVFLALSSLVVAVDITFYAQNNGCAGSGVTYTGVDESTCSVDEGGAVRFASMDDCKASKVYKHGGCSGTPASTGVGNGCFIGGGYKSAKWSDKCSIRSHLESDSTKCQSFAKPTGVVFTDLEKKITWVLTSPHAEELFSQLESLPDGEKANWLQSKGATLNNEYKTIQLAQCQ